MTTMYAKVINEETGLCNVASGTNTEYFQQLSYEEQDVLQSEVDGNYYLSDKCPVLTDDIKQEQENNRIQQGFEYCEKDFMQNYLPYANISDDEGDRIDKDVLYNMEELIRNEEAFVMFDNGIVNTLISMSVQGGYTLHYALNVLNNFKQKLLHSGWSEQYYDISELGKVHHLMFNFTDILRKNSIIMKKCNVTGLDAGFYSNDKSERLSYCRVFTGQDKQKWFVPITLKEYTFKAYDEENVLLGSLTAYGTNGIYGYGVNQLPIQVSTKYVLEKSDFDYNLYSYDDIVNLVKDRFGAASVSNEVVLNKSYTLYIGLIDDWSSNFCAIDTVDSMRSVDDNAVCREIRPYYNCDTWLQKVKDTSGNVGYTDYQNWSVFNAFGGSASCYNNPIGDDVPADANIYSDLKFTSETNTGAYKFEPECFRVPSNGSTDRIAWKAYKIKNELNGAEYWTITSGAENSEANCMAADSPLDVNGGAWRDFTEQWYTVQKGEGTYYVKASDITDTAVEGGYVATETQLYTNRMAEEPAELAGENDTTFTSVTASYAFKFTGETSFVYKYISYEGDDVAKYEKYFSENPSDWGVWSINASNEKVEKIPAFQWECSMTYQMSKWFIDGVFSASKGKNQPIFNIENYYWWVMKVWEVKSSVTEVIAYCPFKGSAGKTTQEHCLTSAGLEAVLPDGENWVYTGGFNADFLGRYTKYKNGEL